jgi:pimeloyl-ACP methyl ester carboxylesterase
MLEVDDLEMSCLVLSWEDRRQQRLNDQNFWSTTAEVGFPINHQSLRDRACFWHKECEARSEALSIELASKPDLQQNQQLLTEAALEALAPLRPKAKRARPSEVPKKQQPQEDSSPGQPRLVEPHLVPSSDCDALRDDLEAEIPSSQEARKLNQGTFKAAIVDLVPNIEIRESGRQSELKPFQAHYHLNMDNSRVDVCQHLCKKPRRGIRHVVICCPGILGGAGPGCRPGQTVDKNCAFRTIARELTRSDEADVDCYRLSWASANPGVLNAATAVLHALCHATQANGINRGEDAHPVDEFRVFFVGHSFGGMVVVAAAETASTHYRDQQHPRVVVEGICTLNTSFDPGWSFYESLVNSRALLISGTADDVVTSRSTKFLYKALPMSVTDKKKLEFQGGTHDLFEHRAAVVDEIVAFVLDSHNVPETANDTTTQR